MPVEYAATAKLKVCLKCKHYRAKFQIDYREHVCSLVYEPIQVEWKKVDHDTGGFYFKSEECEMWIPFHCPYTLEHVVLKDDNIREP